MNTYCLFCNTVKCALVAETIQRRLGYEAFSPKIVQRKWIKGVPIEEVHDFLPGYVFLYTEDVIESFQPIWSIGGVLRVLGNQDEGFLLQGTDERFAGMLHANHGILGIMKVRQEGERVRLTKGGFGDVEGEIIRLDKRKGRAQVQYTFDGMTCTVWVGYELIE